MLFPIAIRTKMDTEGTKIQIGLYIVRSLKKKFKEVYEKVKLFIILIGTKPTIQKGIFGSLKIRKSMIEHTKQMLKNSAKGQAIGVSKRKRMGSGIDKNIFDQTFSLLT
jgi:hypothetical protein